MEDGHCWPIDALQHILLYEYVYVCNYDRYMLWINFWFDLIWHMSCYFKVKTQSDFKFKTPAKLWVSGSSAIWMDTAYGSLGSWPQG